MKIRKYLANCFLLLLPVFLWNIIFYSYLPERYGSDIFEKDIPSYISISENILRILIFSLPILMIFSLKSRRQKIGFYIYLVGLLIYFSSWIMMMSYIESDWSRSLIAFMAPAFTPLIFFVGIGLIGEKSFVKIPYLSAWYIFLSILFVFFHSMHAYIVFEKVLF